MDTPKIIDIGLKAGHFHGSGGGVPLGSAGGIVIVVLLVVYFIIRKMMK